MPMLFYILFAVVLFGGGGALLYMMPPSEEGKPPTVSDKVASTDPQAKQPEAKQESAAREAAGDEQASPSAEADAPVPPSFDVVRIEKDGSGVIAGQAEPGWTVIVESNGEEVARATADRFGEWVVVLDKPLPPGEHSIGLRALSQGAGLGRASEQHVSVSIADEEETVVALSSPGEPTRVLTPKDQAEAAPAARTPQVAAREFTPDVGSEPVSGPAERKPEPEAVRPEEQKPAQAAASREQTPAPAPVARAPEVAVSFSAVDYEVASDGSGELFLSGEATAGARVQLYLNNERIGDTRAGSDGHWTFSSNSKLQAKTEHTMRADAVQPDGQVTSRAEVAFTPPVIAKRQTRVAANREPAPSAVEKPAAKTGQPVLPAQPVATAPPQPPAPVSGKPEVTETAKEPVPAEEAPGSRSDKTVMVAEEARSAPAPVEKKPAAPLTSSPAQQPVQPSASAQPSGSTPLAVASAEQASGAQPDAGERAVLAQKRSIVVRRGDTLWHIAERRYGRGIRYTAIYRDNRDQIRDPDLIYPGQEFSLPANAR